MSHTLYLAGPMRGRRDFNFPAFLDMAAALRRAGHEVFCPAEHDIERYGMDAFRSETGDLADIPEAVDFDLRRSLGADLEFICTRATGVAVLRDWDRSSGAKAEVATAIALGIPVFRPLFDQITGAILYRVTPTITAVETVRLTGDRHR